MAAHVCTVETSEVDRWKLQRRAWSKGAPAPERAAGRRRRSGQADRRSGRIRRADCGHLAAPLYRPRLGRAPGLAAGAAALHADLGLVAEPDGGVLLDHHLPGAAPLQFPPVDLLFVCD